MAYKKTVKLRFESKKDFDQINNQLEKAGLELASFATFCLNRVWSEIIQEHQRQQQQLLEAKQEQEAVENEAASVEPNLSEESTQVSESSDSEESSDGQAVASEEK